MLEIRYVQIEDKEFWYSLDRHLSEQEFIRKIADKRGYVLLNNKTGDNYYAVYGEDKELLSEEGQWYLQKDKNKTITNYLDYCLEMMGV